ncbi:head maturation protease, ClpP-related [Chordicoccus furentiruminis]|uniref:head maturation protease, ClpP-related n=1 Tax=Chordicoccus furentiruminis TaxID=2709410 RepID=UPI0023A7EA95|nr:head maturation protease, ClpP-related [Chordicoccus furentiruminis]
MKKFWNWIRDDTGGRILRLEGPIDSESFWGDEITPAMFRQELEAEEGDLTVWINSPGGNVFAAAEIYTMLKDYKGAVTVKIASIAASAASVVAMAGSRVLMSPTALLMIHDPSTIAMGNTKAMEQAITTLNEVKESIINAYAAKTGLRHNKIAELMSNETWMNAKKAVELGFADEVLYEDKGKEPEPEEGGDADPKTAEPVLEALLYQGRVTDMAVLNSLGVKDTAPEEKEPDVPRIGMDGKTETGAMPYEILKRQLDFLR